MMNLRLWATTNLLACALAVYSSNFLLLMGVEGATFTFQNSCKYTVWPGLLPNGGSQLLADGGFELGAGQSMTLNAPVGWSGRFWGRTGCSFSSSASPSAIACETGDCGNGKLQCSGTGAATPATLAEITLAGTQPNVKQDFYDVSLVDGYNIPIAIAPSVSNPNSSGSYSQQHTSAATSADSYVCEIAGCIADLNLNCPGQLQVLASATASAGNADGSSVVGCKSACEAFLSAEYCCTGSYANPTTCQPTSYSRLFKQACPRAYSYAFDDPTSTFTCTGADYSIIFCPSSLSQKSGVGSTFDASGARTILSCCWRRVMGLVVLNIIASFFAL